MESIYAVKGNIIFTREFGKYEIYENSYIVVEGKYIKGIFSKLSTEYLGIAIKDYGNAIIIPGFVDLHLHAPQFANLGLGLDKELMPWLETYTFPEEAKYNDTNYARKVYGALIKELWKLGTTRSVVFATIHLESTIMLMEMIDKAGLSAFVGKVNMDRNAPENIIQSAELSLLETEKMLMECCNKFENVKPIITPRFVPTCSEKLMNGLGILAQKYKVAVQSHLSESYTEIGFVKQLHPEHKNYASVYDKYGLFGQVPTVMAHCIHVTEEEIELMAKNQVFVAHSSNSNCNLASGIAPIRKLLCKGVPVGLGSDISGGHTLSMMDVIVNSAQVANLKWLESDKRDTAFSTAELFYLATKGGGKFFGKVGSFEEGYEFDALVIDDSSLTAFRELSLEERLQKFIYTGDDRNIIERFVAGKIVPEPIFEG